MKTLTIQLNPSYDIYFLQGLFQSTVLSDFLRNRAERLVIITDSHLKSTIAKAMQDYLMRHQLSAEIISFSAGETHKTRETKQALEDQLLKKEYGRDTCLIAVGGGVVTDITGFLAATYCRGISAVYVPTSLLAMVDASIGGKTGVNTPFGKNMIGCFYQPKAVFIDVNFLSSLPFEEIRNGYAEMIKHALIADADLFEKLSFQSDFALKTKPGLPYRFASRSDDLEGLLALIFRSCEIKKEVVEQDERDQNLRHILNFGHTIAHAIETLENYQIRHGEAVAIGMLVEAYISVRMGFLSQEAFQKILGVIRLYQFACKTKAWDDIQLFKQALILDKKSSGKTAKFILLDQIGRVHSETGRYALPVSDLDLDDALHWVRQFFLGTGGDFR